MQCKIMQNSAGETKKKSKEEAQQGATASSGSSPKLSPSSPIGLFVSVANGSASLSPLFNAATSSSSSPSNSSWTTTCDFTNLSIDEKANSYDEREHATANRVPTMVPTSDQWLHTYAKSRKLCLRPQNAKLCSILHLHNPPPPPGLDPPCLYSHPNLVAWSNSSPQYQHFCTIAWGGSSPRPFQTPPK